MSGHCIFCGTTTGPFTTREHILPESLGGGDWAILAPGLYCDGCQNHFGSTIEQQALADYPFSFFRVFLGIPTKKGKPPWTPTWEGTIRASLRPGTIGYDPSPPFQSVMESGTKTQLRLLAEPVRPEMICRTLLKIGLEVVANNNPEDAYHERYDAARAFARYGRKDGAWWYLHHEDPDGANHYITRGVTSQEWTQNVQLATVEIGDGAEVLHLKLLYLDLFVPLEQRIQPPKENLPAPEFRLFLV